MIKIVSKNLKLTLCLMVKTKYSSPKDHDQGNITTPVQGNSWNS